MVDLASLMQQKRRHDASQRLQDAYLLMSVNNRAIDDTEYKRYIQDLQRTMGVKQEAKFNRDKFEELRAFTNYGK
jgi:hypothetical protein